MNKPDILAALSPLIDYLRRWARELNVSDLLDRAFSDAGFTTNHQP
ncbi:MAG: hypothetical protein JXA71_13530 [Chitinispirillaceae bacterium]|nr:hypothetical protein [Chitinispirillaceae bacterium]